MKRKILIIISLIVILVVGGILIFIKNNNKIAVNGDELIILNEEKVIKAFVEYKIEDTDDTFVITEAVNFPKIPENTTVSFDIIIPYTITVNGTEYQGIYYLGNSKRNEIDSNCNYDLEVNDLDKDGNITIKLRKK